MSAPQHSQLPLRAGVAVREGGLVGTVDLLPRDWCLNDAVALRYSMEAEFVASKMEDECSKFG